MDVLQRHPAAHVGARRRRQAAHGRVRPLARGRGARAALRGDGGRATLGPSRSVHCVTLPTRATHPLRSCSCRQPVCVNRCAQLVRCTRAKSRFSSSAEISFVPVGRGSCARVCVLRACACVCVLRGCACVCVCDTVSRVRMRVRTGQRPVLGAARGVPGGGVGAGGVAPKGDGR